MACTTFPSTGLVPGVTTHVVGSVTYRWSGVVWEAITAPLTAESITNESGGTVQEFVDSFALKIFQSPTDGGLTEISTRTLEGGEVYEVRKVSDDSLATIYSDKGGVFEIEQDGDSNVSGSNGTVKFFVADGDYYVEVDSVQSNFKVNSKGSTLNITVAELYSVSPIIGEYYRLTDRGAIYVISEIEPPTNGADKIDIGNGLMAGFSDLNKSVDNIMLGYTDASTQEFKNLTTQRAIDVAIDKNIELNIYNAKTTAQATIGSSINIGDIKIDGSDFSSSGAVLRFEGGSADALPSLAGNLNDESRNITFSASHGLSLGDVVCIYNPSDGSYLSARPSYREGEFAKVSEVVSTTEVRLDRTLYSGYTSANVDIYKVNTISFSKKGVIDVSYSAGSGENDVEALSFYRVVDSDVSNTKAFNEEGTTSLEFHQCIGFTGSNISAEQLGDNGLPVAYGVLFASCQDFVVRGRFTGWQHGSTTGSFGGVCDVVNRNLHIKGEFTSTDPNGTNFGADFHGNTEHCVYDGIFNDGIFARGNHNKYRGVCHALSLGGNVILDELKGYDHDFSEVKFVGNTDPFDNFNGRGAIDLNGVGSDSDEFATKGGVLNFKNATFDNPQATRVLNLEKKNSIDSIVDITGFRITNCSTTGTVINITSIGFTGDWLETRAYSFTYPTGSLFVFGSLSVKAEFSGVLEINTGSSTLSQSDVNFPHRFGVDDVPSVNVSYEGGFVGSIIPQPYLNAVRNQDAQIGIATPDASNFSSNIAVKVHWSARVD